MEYSKYQKDIFNWVENGQGNLLIDAKAGSGKSSTILQASTKMSGSIIFLAFNRKIASELEYKLLNMGMPNAKASTIHKEGLGVITKSLGRVKVDGSKVFWITEKYCQSSELSPARNFIAKLVGFAKQDAFGVDGQTSINDTKAWMDIIAHHDITLEADCDFCDVIEIAKDVLRESNKDLKTVDFDDMQYFPLLLNLPCTKYDWVLVDECQDLNVCRRLIGDKILKESGRIILVGDKKQAIYNFAGASSNSMELIKLLFNCSELPLSVCYRCDRKIIEEAQKYCPEIEFHPVNGEGEVSSMKYQEFIDKALTMNLDKSWGVVCRNNAPNVALAFALIRQGIGVRIEGREIGADLIKITKRWKRVKNLTDFTIKLNEFFTKEFEKANYAKMQLLEDKLDTIIILIERCQELGMDDLYSLEKLIKDMFSDSDGNTPNIITLSSIHKSKGLEWPNLLILGESQFSPSRYATTEVAKEEEENLIYVSITRAKHKLIRLTDVPSRRSKED